MTPSYVKASFKRRNRRAVHFARLALCALFVVRDEPCAACCILRFAVLEIVRRGSFMGIADEAALYALGYWMHENHPTRIDIRISWYWGRIR